MHSLLCIPLGHDCVPTIAHAVVLPLRGIAPLAGVQHCPEREGGGREAEVLPSTRR